MLDSKTKWCINSITFLYLPGNSTLFPSTVYNKSDDILGRALSFHPIRLKGARDH
jgi:hypothetical protein